MMIDATGTTTSARSGATGAANESLGERATGLGREAFLQLLITQLGNQNPLAPQADGEFIAQLAQFSALEQLTSMNDTLTRLATAMGVDVAETGTTTKAQA
jgi:flagellar basal-body rod modification protein FlgD